MICNIKPGDLLVARDANFYVLKKDNKTFKTYAPLIPKGSIVLVVKSEPTKVHYAWIIEVLWDEQIYDIGWSNNVQEVINYFPKVV